MVVIGLIASMAYLFRGFSLDTNKEEHFASFDVLRTKRRFRLPLAARLLQFFAPKEGLLIETDSESPAGAGISTPTTATPSCVT